MDKEIQKALMCWYEEEGRSFFWRERDLDPYEVLLVEVCLRRTTPESVDNSIQDILSKIPKVGKARDYGKEELKEIFRPLGLQSKRAKEFKLMIGDLIEKYGGNVPNERGKLLEMEGVGPYIAEAVLVYAYNKKYVLFDPNTARVAEYYFGVSFEEYPRNAEEVKKVLTPVYWPPAPQYNWALIDLGSLMKRRDPNDPLKQYYS